VNINTIFKAVFAFLVAFAGAIGAATSAKNGDIGSLDIGAWTLAIGAGLTAAGALIHNPDKSAGGLGGALGTVQDVVAATTQAQQDLTKQAVDAINAVLSAVGKVVPVPTVSVLPNSPAPPTVIPPAPPQIPQGGVSGLPTGTQIPGLGGLPGMGSILSSVPIIGGLVGAGESLLGPLASQVVDKVNKAAG
jgi:hypothetical protein